MLAALLGDYAKLIAPTFWVMIFNGAKFAANLFPVIVRIKGWPQRFLGIKSFRQVRKCWF
jgi:hypothetical protein